MIVGSFQDLEVTFYGGPFAERQRAIIAPEYFRPEAEDFEISLFEIDYPQKFVTLQHQHILGTIMSLGIERDQLGDILIDDRIQFTLTKQLESYIMLELNKIKGATVKLNAILVKNMIQSKEHWRSFDTTVSGLRLDVVLKEIIRKSRSIGKQLIEKKRVKVNHTIIDSVDFQLDQGDLLSVQGYGRAMITDIGGKTKKDKIRISYKTLFK